MALPRTLWYSSRDCGICLSIPIEVDREAASSGRRREQRSQLMDPNTTRNKMIVVRRSATTPSPTSQDGV
eukprot:scaffold2968_cov172-Amphora_coffeaeformis.AAC.1